MPFAESMRSLRIVAFPRAQIDYTALLYAALERLGATVEEGVFSGRRLRTQVRAGDVVHFHWPSFYYARPGKLATVVAFLRWSLILLLMRVRGARIVWSAHNLLPHDRAAIPSIDVLARHVMIAMSDRIFVHGAHAAERLVERFPAARAKLVQIPHGHFIGLYPNRDTQPQAREALGVSPTAFVYLFIGLCKPYKNVHFLLEEFRKLDGDVALVVAGKFQSDAYREQVAALAAADPRVILHPGFIADDAMGRYLAASDAVVAPYRETLTSGTAMLAMSFGRPLVSIASGHLLDVVDHETGELYDAADASGLRDALNRIRRRAFDESRILEHARRYTFDDAAARMHDALCDQPQRVLA